MEQKTPISFSQATKEVLRELIALNAMGQDAVGKFGVPFGLGPKKLHSKDYYVSIMRYGGRIIGYAIVGKHKTGTGFIVSSGVLEQFRTKEYLAAQARNAIGILEKELKVSNATEFRNLFSAAFNAPVEKRNAGRVKIKATKRKRRL